MDDNLDFLKDVGVEVTRLSVSNKDVSSDDILRNELLNIKTYETSTPTISVINDNFDKDSIFSSPLPNSDVKSAIDDDIFSEILSTPYNASSNISKQNTESVNNLSNNYKSDSDFMNWLSDINDTPVKTISNDIMITNNHLSKSSTSTLETPKNLSSLSNSFHVPVNNQSAKKESSMEDFFEEVFGNSTLIEATTLSAVKLDPRSQNDGLMVTSSLNPLKLSAERSVNNSNSIKNTSKLLFDPSKDVEDIIHSTFPNIDRLKDTIKQQLGYIPETYRGEVWNLLLTGQPSQDDHEILNYNIKPQEMNNFIQIGKDCDAIITKYTSQNEFTLDLHIDLLEKRQLMSKILMLYCSRRQIEYNRIFANLLSPMLFCDKPIKVPVASSCFYNLASSFFPFLSTKKNEAQAEALVVVHTWLRLLVNYHNPMLVQYLDKVLPGWEQSSIDNNNILDYVDESQSGETLIANEISTRATSAATTPLIDNSLDELDKELGLSIPGIPVITTNAKSVSFVMPNKRLNSDVDGCEDEIIDTDGETKTLVRSESEYVMARMKTRIGAIPASFICGMFTSSLPPQQAVVMIDWSIYSNEKYAAVYYTAALLDIFSSDLLTMTGAEIRSWFEDISVGKKEWYKYKPGTTNIPGNYSKLTWEKFTNGWIYAANALKLSTPLSFHQALNSTDDWVMNRLRDRQSQSSIKIISSDRRQENILNSVLSENTMNSYSEEEEDVTSPSKPTVLPPPISQRKPTVIASTDSAESGRTGDFIDRFLNMTPTTRSASASAASATDAMLKPPLVSSSSSSTINPNMTVTGTSIEMENLVGNSNTTILNKYKLKSHPHETKSDDLTMSLWCCSEEVIPCLCSNQRRPNHSESVITYFQLGIDASTESLTTTSNAANTTMSDYSKILSKPRRGDKGVSFPLNSEFYPDLKPFYFGIDCRPAQERVLGQFPKAYVVDDLSSDSDEISALLDTLKPLASSVHLCIIGSGYDYFAYKHKENVTTLSHEMSDYESKLNSIIMFFQKKNFRHVSFLDGGFMDAARYLRRADTPMDISQALIDVDTKAIDSILGIQFTANTTSNSSIMTAAINSVSLTSQVVPVVEKTKKMFGDIGQKIASISIWNKSASKSSSSSSSSSSSTNDTVKLDNQGFLSVSRTLEHDQSSTPFVIDGDDDEEEEHRHKTSGTSNGVDHSITTERDKDTNTISISRTDQQRQQALAMHKLAGLRRGDSIILNKDNLPGAILFPAIVCTEDKNLTSDHRFLAITRERFIVLDSRGKGVGSQAVVMSNNHLTELQKMTFRKKDPEFITLFFMTAGTVPFPVTDDVGHSSPENEINENIQNQLSSTKGSNNNTQAYRISKRVEFIDALQSHMARFK